MRCLIVMFILITTTTLPGQELVMSTSIDKVVLYKSGAEVTRVGELNLQSGLNEVSIIGLPSDLMEGSISLSSEGGVEVVSLDANVNMERPDNDDIFILTANQRIVIINDSLRLLEKKISVLQQEKVLMQKDNYASKENFNLQTYKDLIAYKRESMYDIDESILSMEQEGRELKKTLNVINNEIRKYNVLNTKENYHIGAILNVNQGGVQRIEVSYFIEDAGWTPEYDVIVDDITKPIELVYKASVYQDSYEDWEDVDLTLSSGAPKFGYSQPSLSPYYLYFNNYVKDDRDQFVRPYKGNKISGRVTDSSGEVLVGANVLLSGTSQGTITDIDGTFSIINNANSNQVVVSYVGYDTKAVSIYAPYLDIKLQEGAMLEEVVVTGYGGSGAVRSTSKVKVRGVASLNSQKLEGKIQGVSIYAGVQRYKPTVEYKIKDKISIEGLDDPKTILVKSAFLSADLFYRTIPKSEESAFLFAKIDDWEGLNLQSGTYNVQFEGRYLTNYSLDMNNVEEELEMALGIDEDIRVRREPIKDFTKKTFLSKNIKEKKSWKISVFNGKKVPILIEIQDQYPLSKNGDIDVDLQEDAGAMKNQQKGTLKWRENIPPGESIEKILTYEVKYPKARNLIVD